MCVVIPGDWAFSLSGACCIAIVYNIQWDRYQAQSSGHLSDYGEFNATGNVHVRRGSTSAINFL